MPDRHFSPLVRRWFEQRYGRPTAVQAAAWPVVASGDHVLISAATGSGKSLAAWLPLVDRLHRCQQDAGVRLLYVSPLRALSRDMAAGVVDCLDGLASMAGRTASGLRIGIRTGDTTPAERAAQRRRPPDILLTTPESLFVLLGSPGGRKMLSSIDSVMVDEIHALVDNKRGAHLALSLERLAMLTEKPLQRIGITATARPLRLVAGFLVGAGRGCRIVAPPAMTVPEVAVELPDQPLGPFAHGGHWRSITARLLELARQPGTMLVFCNTRAMVERVATQLGEGLDESQVAAHHGSIGRQRRQGVESGLKHGQLKVVVCSSSLELGIDIGSLDRVCQLGSCFGINSFRQRAGRARHRPDTAPRMHIFPLTLADLLDVRALQASVACGQLDPAQICSAPLDVLAQQLVAMVAAGCEDSEVLFEQTRTAMPWRRLARRDFDRVVDMLHEGYVPGRETAQGPVFKRGSGRLGAAEKADKRCLLNAGTIPEWFEYDVVCAATGRVLGRLDEEFAFESSPGQIMQLGGQNWRILCVRPGLVEVEPAVDETPNLPFWFGEGAGRSRMLSRAVMDVCADTPAAVRCEQLDNCLAQSRSLLGSLPGRRQIVLERFFDPGGDQHLVIHSLAGAAINRAWGLALRKRFCRNFNFELQAAATDNGILISLGAVHSFELSDVAGWLRSHSVGDVLTQALLDTPMFQTRLRWCANTALAIERRSFRGKVPAQIQRNQTENLIARIFPDQLACLENLSGERRIPDHPLVEQALRDCLEDFMDLPGLIRLLQAIEQGRVTVTGVDTAEPSPLAMALVHAPRNSFLDPAAAEERRTRSFEQPAGRVSNRAPGDKAAPVHQTRDQFEQGLLRAGYLTAAEVEDSGNSQRFMALVRERLAVGVQISSRTRLWAHIEQLGLLLAVWPAARLKPFLPAGLRPDALADSDEALRRLLLGRIRHCRASNIGQLVAETGLTQAQVVAALEHLKAEGLLMTSGSGEVRQWQERSPGVLTPGNSLGML